VIAEWPCPTVVTDRDIVCRLVAKGENPNDHLAKDCMSSPVVTCMPNMDLADCARLMEQYQVRRVPVVDEAGVCCGIVAQADLATKGPRAMIAEVMAKVSQPIGAASAVQAS
jgi:CBS-domain-containing membrane protein